MKTIFKLRAAKVAMTFITFTAASSANFSHAQTNILLNGSFEGPNISPGAVSSVTPTDWTGAGSGLIINPTSFAANEDTYLPLGATDGSQVFELASSSSLSQIVTLDAGHTYDFSFDLSALQLQNGPAAYDAVVDVNITDNQSGHFNHTFNVSAGTTSWSEETFAFTTTDSGNF